MSTLFPFPPRQLNLGPQVQNGISSALDGDVPNRLNDILASLPTRIDVTGLPFSTTFEYRWAGRGWGLWGASWACGRKSGKI